jgi:chaperonin GroES
MPINTVSPLGKRVLIQRSQAKALKGKILIPNSSQEKPKEGTVIAVGPGIMEENGTFSKIHLNKGDKVLYSSYAGTEVKLENTREEEEYLILSEEDILGTLN